MSKWKYAPGYATNKCVVCGHELEKEGDHSLCCSTASYSDTEHLDPYCKACCGPHIPLNPQVTYYPEG